MNITYKNLPHCITATIKCGQLTFQGAGKTEQEAVSYMWAMYNRYYHL
jgi:hypothetical protein